MFPVFIHGLDPTMQWSLEGLQRIFAGSKDCSVESASTYSSLGQEFAMPGRPPKLFQCPRCNQRFGHPRSIYRHRKACEGQFDFKCEFCGKCFHRMDSLKSHAQKHILLMEKDKQGIEQEAALQSDN